MQEAESGFRHARALLHGSLDMLLESRTCLWYQLDVVLPSKQLAVRLVTSVEMLVLS